MSRDRPEPVALPARPRPKEGGTPALSGQLAAVSLFDLCQFLMLNRKTGTLTVRSGTGVAYLTFHEGQLLTALDESLGEGEGVVLRAVQWTTGGFEFSPGPVPPERKIQASTENILLEAARKIDEMQEEDRESVRSGGWAGGREGGAAHQARASQEAAFLETQRRAKSLTEAFRAAVYGGGVEQAVAGWKEQILRAVVEGEAGRVLLGPLGRVVRISAQGIWRIDGASAAEVEEWMNELAPVRKSAGGRAEPDPARLRLLEVGPGCRLWVGRFASSAGDWVSLGPARVQFPAWDTQGYPEELRRDLLQTCRAPVWLLEGAPGVGTSAGASPLAGSPARKIVAAHLAELARSCPPACWIVEAFPEYDWSNLAGSVETVQPARLRARGALAELCAVNTAGAVYILDPVPAHVLAEALELGEHGIAVTVAGSARWKARMAGAHFRDPQRPGEDALLPTAEESIVWLIERASSSWGFRRISGRS